MMQVMTVIQGGERFGVIRVALTGSLGTSGMHEA
jgi:hypothetical protein